MPFELFKFLHIGSMFVATALAVGPSLVLYLVARTENAEAIRRAFRYATPIGRAGGVCYGLGIVFGASAALSGSLDLTAHWLLTAYALVVVLAANGLLFDRWSHRVAVTAGTGGDGGPALPALIRSATPLVSLALMVVITLAIVFVMVVKPDLLG